ncbi:MAG TPA: hypothetical protein VGL81_19055 [Polyangiaceae bacterium]|jgi:hypothetical protein
MSKMWKASALTAAVAAGLALFFGTTANAENRNAPQFSCGVSFGAGNEPMVTITKTAGGAPDPTKDVFASITTPNGKVSATVCGKQLQSNGSHASVSFSTQVKSGYIYLCTAAAGTTTFACNPVR